MIKNTSNGLKKISDDADRKFNEAIKRIDKKFEDFSKKGFKDIKVKTSI